MRRKRARGILIKIRHYIFLIALILVFSILITDFLKGGITHSIFFSDVSELSETIQRFGLIAPLIFIFFVTLEVMLAPIPGFIFYVTGAVLFGWFWGGVLTLIGNMIGASLAFFLAKYLGRDYVEKKVDGEKWQRFDRYTEKYGGYAIFFLRINPFTSSDIFSYLSGFTKISFRSFFFGTLLGLLPLSFLQTYFGENLVKSSPMLYWLFLIISILYFFVVIYFIYKARKE